MNYPWIGGLSPIPGFDRCATCGVASMDHGGIDVWNHVWTSGKRNTKEAVS